MGNPFLEFGVLILLLILNGVFSASELAMVSAKKSRLEANAERGNKKARTALRLANNPGRFLATVQVGITLIGTMSAVFAGENLTRHFEPLLRPAFGTAAGVAASAVVVLIVTFLSLVLGELAPKNIALRNPEGLATFVAPFMAVLSKLVRPVVWLLDITSRALLRLFGIVGERQEFVTEEDVRALVMQAAESGSLETGESERIERVLRFNDRRVRDLMTPRTEVAVINLNDGLDSAIKLILATGHDHYPVRSDNSDIIGVLSVMDVLRAAHTHVDLPPLVKPALFVPEAAWAEDALTQLERQGRQRLAVVVDEYGDFTGILSISDLLAELAGVEDDSGDDQLVQRGDGSYLVDGGAPMYEVREVLALPELEDEDFATIAGYVLATIGHLPIVGETVEVDGWRLEVVDLDGARVDRILITPPGEGTPSGHPDD